MVIRPLMQSLLVSALSEEYKSLQEQEFTRDKVNVEYLRAYLISQIAKSDGNDLKIVDTAFCINEVNSV